MTRVLGLFIFAFLLIAAPAKGQDLCDKDTDVFTKKKSVMCEYDVITIDEHPPNYIDWARVAILTVENTFLVGIATKSDSWNFLNNDRAYALIDGERYEWGLYEIRTEAEGEGVRELHGIEVGEKGLEAIAEGRKIRIKYGGAVFNLTGSTIQKQAQETQALLSQGV